MGVHFRYLSNLNPCSNLIKLLLIAMNIVQITYLSQEIDAGPTNATITTTTEIDNLTTITDSSSTSTTSSTTTTTTATTTVATTVALDVEISNDTRQLGNYDDGIVVNNNGGRLIGVY